jgi:hypothetical protein
MPQKKSSRRLITPLLLFSLAGWALWALGRNEPAQTERRSAGDAEPRKPAPTPAPTRERATWSKRRLATSLAFVTLFFAGAAFSAGAGDAVVEALEGQTTTAASTEEEAVEDVPAEEEAPAEEPAAEEEAPAEPAPAEEAPAEEPQPAPADEDPAEQPAPGGDGGSDDPAGNGEQPSEPGEAPEPSEQPSGNGGSGGQQEPGSGGGEGEAEEPAPPHLDEGESAPVPAPDEPSLVGNAPDGPAHLDPEADAEGFFATVWLHRTMPDPTPPATRLTPLFAKTLAREASRAKVDWAIVLGVLRARGFDGGTMNTTAVRRTAEQLAALGARRDAWRAILAYRGRTAFADRAMALTRYNRAVGLSALVSGLQAAKPALQRKVLADRRLSVYPGGRLDIAMGRTDVRVLVLVEYLAEAHRQVTVSSLTTGHGIYSRPGVVSAHTYGLAVDVAALAGSSILGNQGPNSLTERAVRNILLLPAELQPRQVISLLGLGGPSFPMANHHDHIHVGY